MTESTTAPRRAAIAFIFITVVLDILALGMVIPVLPRLVAGFLDNDTARAAQMFGVFGTVWALMQFFASPVLGALSDRFGRRPIVLISNFGLGLDYLLMAWAPTLGWLFAGRVISGITAASIPTAYAYIADVTPVEKRAAAFGLMGAAFGLGFVLGPALGGFLGSIDLHLPFWVAAGLSLANGCYGTFVLPESLPKDRRSPFEWRKANPVGSLKLLRSHPELFSLALVIFLCTLAHEVLPSVSVLYTGYRYHWTERDVGMMLAGVGICVAIVQGGLVRFVIRRFGEWPTLTAGLVCGAIGFAVYGLAPNGAIFCIGVPIVSLWGLSGAASNGIMTRHVKPTEQGQLQGANNSLRGIAGLFGPGIHTATFASFIGERAAWHLPGAPFLLSSILLLLALAAVWRARTRDVNLAPC